MLVEPVAGDEVRPLRHAVLRPHRPFAETAFPGDVVEGALHVAARERPGAPVIGVASVAPEPHPRTPADGDWRVRGMAAAPQARRQGVGLALLEACVAHARAQGGRRVWCNARTPAAGFYERAGWTVESEVFEIAGIGPHVVMSLAL